MNPVDVETNAIRLLVGEAKTKPHEVLSVTLFASICNETLSCDVSSVAAVRSHFSPWWRVSGNLIDVCLGICDIKLSHSILGAIHAGFQNINTAFAGLIDRMGLDRHGKECASLLAPFFLAYTSAVRAALESIHCIADPMLGCDILVGLESVVPMDNKGISNVYKRCRQVSDDHVRSIIDSVTPESPADSFEEGNVVMENPLKSFERFWTMMDVSRRCEPELLTETRSWGKFSQSATQTLNIISEQADDLDARSNLAKEPVEYECKSTSFGIQMSSASFRRRAVLNILFTCAYVSQNSSNALITAAAKTLYSTTLKSLPSELQTALTSINRFDSHWISWKSSTGPLGKEVCGPFLKRSRIERNMEPLGEKPVDLSSAVQTSESTVSKAHADSAAVKIVSSSHMEENMMDSHSGAVRSETLKSKIQLHRQYVNDAILCDISDDAERERLAASDEGMEEAMRNNNDRVLLWQFKRMRFATDLKSFYAHKLGTQSAETTPVESSQE
jgi:hypothetical protein